MIREMFIGRAPSHFEFNSVIKAFIIGEMMLWSAWNSIYPIIALFAIQLPGGDIKTAASAYSLYLVVRVVFELVSGRLLVGSGDMRKFAFTILGVSVLSFAYYGFAYANASYELFLFYAVAGCGMGIATPAKNSLFSSHLDKEHETLEWSMMDAAVFLCMALSGALGGFVAEQYGFKFLFLCALVINVIGIIPYILYIRSEKTHVWNIFFGSKKRHTND